MPDDHVPEGDEQEDAESAGSAQEFDESVEEEQLHDERRWYEEDEIEEAPVREDPSELVTIATYGSPPEAEVARLVLDEAGIPVFLAGLETDAMLRLWNIAGVKLQVRRSDKDAALALLAEKSAAARAGAADDIGEETDSTVCLACGTPMPEENTACPSCGWSYADDQETRIQP